MKIYSTESLEELSSECQILNVVCHYLKIRNPRKFYMAKCPFHQDEKETFCIDAIHNIYYCDTCGARGNSVEFLMNYLKLDFCEAVEILAFKFDVILEETESKPDRPRMSREESLKEATRLIDLAQSYLSKLSPRQD